MPCYHPSRVGIRRKPLRPGHARVTQDQVVPCGHCLGCRKEQARQWAVRMTHESVMHDNAWFITLTYSDENLPEHGSLQPEHSREFWKSLRRSVGRLSYYLCGEYGDRTQRPHYHAILYGPDFSDRDLYTSRSGASVWTSATLDAAWGRGRHEITPFNFGAASYVAGYVRKKVSQARDPDHYIRLDATTGELVELVPEFARMSRRPAIGKTWFNRYYPEVYRRDEVIINGQASKPPRAYDKWLEEIDPDLMMKVRLKRYQEQKFKDARQLLAGEKIHQAKVALFQQRDAI